MRTGRAIAAGLLLALVSTIAWAQGEFQAPPAPRQWVTDNAGMLSPTTVRSLNLRLARYERDTGHQIVVWIGRSLEGNNIEDWAARTFDAWDIGQKGKDDGIGVFIFAEDRQLRIEVGYGLEGVIPDAVASRIIREEAVPNLRAGNPDAAVIGVVDRLLSTIGGETSPPPGAVSTRPQPQQRELTGGQLIMLLLIGGLFLIFFITNPRLALFLLFSMASGGRGRGGGGFGGGGFGGGGGRSGGGGASGSW